MAEDAPESIDATIEPSIDERCHGAGEASPDAAEDGREGSSALLALEHFTPSRFECGSRTRTTTTENTGENSATPRESRQPSDLESSISPLLGTTTSEHTENLGKSSQRRSPERLCYTSPLHKAHPEGVVNSGKVGRKPARNCHARVLHTRHRGLVLRGSIFYHRRRIPSDLRTIAGRLEIWKSLQTDSRQTALRRLTLVAADVERELEQLRQPAGSAVDTTLPRPQLHDPSLSRADIMISTGADCASGRGESLGDVYDRYMSDPTHAWSPSTRIAYRMTSRLILAILGSDTPIKSISRSDTRDVLEVLRQLPSNATKRFPRLSPRAAVEQSIGRSDIPRMSAANVNAYLGNFSTFMNWAVTEEFLDRNPARGLRLPDDVAKRDKRHPFSARQLALIFGAPLYTGCVDGERGYALVGPARPRNARYWIPLIALHTGMRLNEICQLDVVDVRDVAGIPCLCVSVSSLVGSVDKRLKTRASDRLIPIHRKLLDLGLVAYAHQKRSAGETKLFGEITCGPRGVRAVAFSKWFTQFLDAAGARRQRTSFHSFRHNFRDELRIARIDFDVAMALGGWAGRSSTSAPVSESYGRGIRVDVLQNAMSLLNFSDVDLSHIQKFDNSSAGG